MSVRPAKIVFCAIVILFVILLLALRADAQVGRANGSLAAENAAVTIGNTGHAAQISISVEGTYDATIWFEGKVDLVNTFWRPMQCFRPDSLPPNSNSGTIQNIAGEQGAYLCSGSGFQTVRARMESYVSGTATVIVKALGTASSVAVMPNMLTVQVSGRVPSYLVTSAGSSLAVKNTTPSAGDLALVVRNLPSGTQDVNVTNFPATQAVTGTFWQATQPISGTVTANAGTNLNTSALALDATLTGGTQTTRVTDGTNTATVKPASTGAVATDKALVVAIHPSTTVGVTGTFWQATQPISGSVSVSNFPATQAVSGTFWQATQPVSGTFWQATQPVSGGTATNTGLTTGLPVLAGRAQTSAPTFTDGNLGYLSMDTAGSLRTAVQNFPSSQTINGTVTIAGSGGTPDVVTCCGGLGRALVVDGHNFTQPVSGTFWQATQPVSGTFWQATQPVSIASMPSTPVTGTFWQATQPVSLTTLPALTAGTAVIGHVISDSGSTTAVTGNVTAVQSTGSNLHVVVDTAPTTAVTLASTTLTANAVVSTVNSSTATLGIGGVFTGTSEDMTEYADIRVTVFADQASATDGLSIQQSSNGTNWDVTDVFTIAAGAGRTFAIGSSAKFFRVVYTNGGVAQGAFRLQTIFHKTFHKPSTNRPADARTNETDTEENTSFLMGYNGTTWDRLRSTTANGLAVDVTRVPANQSSNQTQINGVAVSVDRGTTDTGTQRVTTAQDATYAASTAAKTATAAGTAAFFEICGSASKTIRIQRIVVSGTVATAAIYGDVQIRKTSSAGTGATSTTLTAVPYDSNSAAATATAKFNTVLPTGGNTLVGNIFSQTLFFPITGTVTSFQPQLLYVWRDLDAESPVLRGTAQCLTAGFGTTPTNAPTLSVSVAWTEK